MMNAEEKKESPSALHGHSMVPKQDEDAKTEDHVDVEKGDESEEIDTTDLEEAPPLSSKQTTEDNFFSYQKSISHKFDTIMMNAEEKEESPLAPHVHSTVPKQDEDAKTEDHVDVEKGDESEEIDTTDLEEAPSLSSKQTSEDDVNSTSSPTTSTRLRFASSVRASFRDSQILLDNCQTRNHKSHLFGWPCASFDSYTRRRTTALGCLSSIAVLSVRLLLDSEPTAYFIHSFVVFLDMVLIHLFTDSPWLSVSGEIVTIIFFLAFYFTKETLFELLETTMLAVLCSFHLIKSRDKHMKREERLQDGIEDILRVNSIQNVVPPPDLHQELETLFQNEVAINAPSVDTSDVSAHGWAKRRKRLQGCVSHFFTHFLDGSAGVMYTSFLGLIIDELLKYGNE